MHEKYPLGPSIVLKVRMPVMEWLRAVAATEHRTVPDYVRHLILQEYEWAQQGGSPRKTQAE